MGGSQSSRRLTINNEEGVIQISADLVERLTHSNKNGTATSASSSTSTSSSASVAGVERATESSEVRDSQQTLLRPVTPPSLPPSNHAVPHHQYPVQAYPEYTMTAYKIQQQKELELQAQDQYWQERLYKLKLTHEKINKMFQNEYKRAVDEITNAQGKKSINLDSVVPPCGADKEKVLKCYQENPREILKCSSVVDEFNNCVDQRRANIIAARC